jgi:aminoglycoside N3'-acetyltransferase
MYASCPAYVDEVGRGTLTAEQEAEVLEKLPPFDADTARSARDNGALVELLRTYPGSRVNNHPARFVAWGAHTDVLFSEQPWDFAFGRGSVLDRIVQLDGKILLLGSDHDNTSFLHYPEHVGEFEGKRIARFQVPVLENGVRVWRAMAEYDTSDAGVHPNWPGRFFSELVDGYLASTNNAGGRVGGARSHLMSARGLLEYSLPIMARVARGDCARRVGGGGVPDVHALVVRRPRQPGEPRQRVQRLFHRHVVEQQPHRPELRRHRLDRTRLNVELRTRVLRQFHQHLREVDPVIPDRYAP